MPEENIDEFMSLWKKKKPEAKEESSESEASIEKFVSMDRKVQLLVEENEGLKEKIKENIALISKTENFIKEALQDKEDLKKKTDIQINELEVQINQLKEENAELKEKVSSLGEELQQKTAELDSNISFESDKLDSVAITTGSSASSDLIDDLNADIAKKKALIASLQKEVEDLTKQNKELNTKIKETSTAAKEAERTISTSTSSNLETLVQDLQSDLNKYKRLVKTLKEENTKLKSATSTSGSPAPAPKDTGEAKKLSKENEKLRKENEKLSKEIEKLKEAAGKKPKVDTSSFETEIKDLKQKLAEKNDIIAELKSSKPAPASESGSSGQMTDLIDDLQKKINKLKNALKEKNQKIKELQG